MNMIVRKWRKCQSLERSHFTRVFTGFLLKVSIIKVVDDFIVRVNSRLTEYLVREPEWVLF